MSLRSSFHRSRTRCKARRANRGHAGRRPRFETVEDRRLLSLTPAANYAAGAEPQAVVAADFNNDGKVDLVTANTGSDNISVLLGSVNGTFGPAIASAAGYRPKSIAVGDFDNDGNLDLTAVNSFPHNVVSMMFGNGDGSFEAPREIFRDFLSTPLSVAVGDFNDDGTMDLALTSSVYYSFYYEVIEANVLLSNGDRTFAMQESAFVEFENPTSTTVVTDFNGDDDLDLLVGVPGDYVRVLLGDGQGHLALAGDQNWFIGDAGTLASMAVGDVNRDGILDLVAQDQTNVKVRLGDGLGGFKPPPGGQSYAARDRPISVALGDFDRDGALDVAVANFGSSNISILRGRGDGTFAPPVHFAAGAGAFAVAAADFNGDGWLDIATANATGNNVSVLINDQIWSPSAPPVYIFVSDASVTEGKRGIKYLTVAVSLSAVSTELVTVRYATQNGTATAGSDYQAQSGMLSFAAGETTKTVRIAIYGDSTNEADELFHLLLSNPTGNAVISDPLGTGLILNDDVARGPGKKK